MFLSLNTKLLCKVEYQAIQKKEVECKMTRQCTTQILLQDDQITQTYKLWNVT